jgi:DNA polymerase III sliding clamp (beta) subunit (PCNA family)
MNAKRDTLVSIFAAVLPGLAKKDGLPQGQSFVFSGGEVITFNDRVTIHHPLPEELKSLTGAVKAGELYRILTKLPAGVDVDVKMTDAELIIATSSIKVQVRCDKEIVNRYASVEAPTAFKPVPEGLLDGLHRASFSASTDLSKPLLTHVYAKGDQVTSCDNKRVTIVTIPGDADPMFVPAPVIPDLLSYSPTEYSVMPGWVHWRNAAGVMFSFRTLEGEYPDVGQFFDGVTDWPTFRFPVGLSEAVSRVSEALDKTQFLPPVTIEIKGGKVIVTGKGPYLTAKERVPTDFVGELTFYIAAEFFSDILGMGIAARIGPSRMCLQDSELTFRHLICLPKINTETANT